MRALAEHADAQEALLVADAIEHRAEHVRIVVEAEGPHSGESTHPSVGLDCEAHRAS
jgi:hypothetical protein